MTWMLLHGEAPLSASPAWEKKSVIPHSLSARTKITNKRIHLNIPRIETIISWALERVKKIRRARVGGHLLWEFTRNSHFLFPPLL